MGFNLSIVISLRIQDGTAMPEKATVGSTIRDTEQRVVAKLWKELKRAEVSKEELPAS